MVYWWETKTFLPGILAAPLVHGSVAYLVESNTALKEILLKNTGAQMQGMTTPELTELLAEKLKIDSAKLRPILENRSSMVLFTNVSGAGVDDSRDDNGSVR